MLWPLSDSGRTLLHKFRTLMVLCCLITMRRVLFLNEFKNRQGFTINLVMAFDLQGLLSPSSNLESPAAPFSKEEIDNIVLNLPSNKTPRPDGFNGFLSGRHGPLL